MHQNSNWHNRLLSQHLVTPTLLRVKSFTYIPFYSLLRGCLFDTLVIHLKLFFHSIFTCHLKHLGVLYLYKQKFAKVFLVQPVMPVCSETEKMLQDKARKH